MEAKVEEAARRKGISEKDVETGLLVKIIYKGLFYMDMELHALPVITLRVIVHCPYIYVIYVINLTVTFYFLG